MLKDELTTHADKCLRTWLLKTDPFGNNEEYQKYQKNIIKYALK